MSNDSLVDVQGLGKRFRLYTHPWDRARDWASGGRRSRHTEFWALRDVSFTLHRGDCLGIIGPNGAGKTTLLRLLSRVIEPTEGRIRMCAETVLPLLELGTGFHPDLTGRQNIYENARLLGLPSTWLTSGLVSQIEEFAELGEFFDRPIRLYSSGMQVRLGFALFASLEPDLLIVDEALSVGDVFFQQKCMDRIDAMRRAHTSLLLVSHDMKMVRRLCQDALVLNHGRVEFLGPSEEAINRYYGPSFQVDAEKLSERLMPREADAVEGMHASDVGKGNILGRGPRHGPGRAVILAARLTNEQRQDTLRVPIKETLHLDILIEARETMSLLSAGVGIYDRDRNVVFSSGTSLQRHRLPTLEPGQSLVVRLSIRFSLQPGAYSLTVGLSDTGRVQDWHERVGPVEVFVPEGAALPFRGIGELDLACSHAPAESLEACSSSG